LICCGGPPAGIESNSETGGEKGTGKDRARNIHIFQRSPGLRSRVYVEWNEHLRFRTHAVFLESGDHDRGYNGSNNHNEDHDCQDETRALRLKTCPLAHVFFRVRHIGGFTERKLKRRKWVREHYRLDMSMNFSDNMVANKKKPNQMMLLANYDLGLMSLWPKMDLGPRPYAERVLAET
jgi:hypothetical protein